MQEVRSALTQFADPERALYGAVVTDHLRFAEFEMARTWLDAVPDAFMVLNQQRQIVFANQALLRLIGESAAASDIADVIGLRLGEALNCVHATETHGGCGTTEFCRTCGAIRAVLNTQRQFTDAVQECRITRADGVALDLRVWTRPLCVENVPYVLFAAEDISAEKRRVALERLFFHDVLTTVTAIVETAKQLQEGASEDVERLKETNLALATRLMEEIVAQQQLTAAESGELHVRSARINSMSILHEVLSLYAQHEVGVGRRIRIDTDAQAAYFFSDRSLVRRVLGNMVKNALEASDIGQVVTLSCRRVEGGVEFSVHNQSAMSTEVQLQVFQRSFSTKGGGRGLGAYGMKLLCEHYLHGAVRFQSSAAAGTTFFARFPMNLPDTQP